MSGSQRIRLADLELEAEERARPRGRPVETSAVVEHEARARDRADRLDPGVNTGSSADRATDPAGPDQRRPQRAAVASLGQAGTRRAHPTSLRSQTKSDDREEPAPAQPRGPESDRNDLDAGVGHGGQAAAKEGKGELEAVAIARCAD